MESHRRITIAVGLAMLVDAALFLAVLPLLPYYAERFDLDTLGVAVLLAIYPASTPVVALASAALTPRLGGRRIALASAVVMIGATVLFAVAPNATVLIFARFLQGAASSTVWTASMAWVTHNAPEDRRGRESGIVMGLFSIGSIAGPGIGVAADWFGTAQAFGGVALLSCGTLIATLLAPAGVPVPRGDPLRRAVGRALRGPLTRAAIAMAVIDPLVFATIDLLVPLDVAARGASTAAIAAAFALGALAGAATGPLGGRAVDRHGPAAVGLVMAVTIALCPLVLAFGLSVVGQLAVIVFAAGAFAACAAAMFPLAALGADAAGVGHGAVNALIGIFWAIGSTVSPLLAGAVAGVSGDTAAYALAAALCCPLVLIIFADGLRSASRPLVADV